MSNERRHHSRITFHAPAQLVAPHSRFDVALLDISLKGALVRLPESAALDVDSECTLHIQLDTLGDAIRMKTHVAHIEDRCAGLLCREIDLDSITHLRRLVELNLGNPALLERELSALIAD